ncbi:hypothetical protein BGZ83_004036 [Gryganskiella cystojenkinii]|nr:hypothetical protein BGZ83_004036 [Gryganskiella cystojenkinii]
MKSSLVLSVLACMALVSGQQFNHTVSPIDDVLIPEGLPMKSVPVHLFRRGTPEEAKAYRNFLPQNRLELRFIEADKYEYDACHHVDMGVELKTDDGKRTIKALNPYAFQNAVRSVSCQVPTKGGRAELHLELTPEYARQARLQWKMTPNTVFGIVIPHDYVDLKKNKACYTDLNSRAQKALKSGPMETVVKLVKQPKFGKGNTIVMSVVRTDLWSQMNREQGVKIYHEPMNQMIAQLVSNRVLKRSIADESGPMWDFEQDMSKASKQAASQIHEKNVHANMDKSSVKGYAQANMSWKQSCFRNFITGNMNCIKWGINSSKIEGMTQINHQARVRIQSKTNSRPRNGPNDKPLLTLTDVKVTSPVLTLLPSTALLGFAVPGVFDLGATAEIQGSVALAILVQASEDLLVNTGSAASCPWTVVWDGSISSVPTIKFGTCTLPGMPKMSVSNARPRNNDRKFSAIHGRGGPIAPNDIYFGPDPDSPRHNGPSKGTNSRQTAAVTVGLTVIPGVHLGLKVVGISGMTAGLTAPLNLNINTKWDTHKTEQCPANAVSIHADGGASLELTTGFFGFDRQIPIVKSPRLVSPAACIRL